MSSGGLPKVKKNNSVSLSQQWMGDHKMVHGLLPRNCEEKNWLGLLRHLEDEELVRFSRESGL